MGTTLIRRRSRFSTAMIFAAAVAGVGVPNCVRGQTLASWVSGINGTWTNAARWSTNPSYPNADNPIGSTYDVVINAPGTYTVSLRSAVTLSSLLLDAPSATVDHRAIGATLDTPLLRVNAGTYLMASNAYTYGEIANTRIEIGAAGTFIAGDGSLTNVALAGSATLKHMTIRNGLNFDNASVSAQLIGSYGADEAGIWFDGTQMLGGFGTVSFDGSGTVALRSKTGTLTIGPQITLQTGTANALVGSYANPASPPPAAPALVNQGTLWARTSNGSLILSGNWRNEGTLKLTAGTLDLGGTFTTAGIGTLDRSGGTLVISGAMDNAGSVFDPSSLNGTVQLRGTISGGTIRASESDQCNYAGTFNNVTVDGQMKGSGLTA
jgi:hypothetical protein